MREIKFRAWDKRQEVMIPVDQVMRLEFGKNGVDWLGCWVVVRDNEGDPEQGLHQISREDLELMQFTGLLDKNGKEIYEGDILHITTPDMVNLNYKTVVEWTDRGFYKDFTNYSMSEIIGNIYENKDLL